MTKKERFGFSRNSSANLYQTRRFKKAQMQISFGMIFSIILIIFFLAFAFYAIKIFLKSQDNAKAAKLVDDIQGDIDRIWNSGISSEKKEYIMPSYADFICFIDFSPNADVRGENSAFYFEIKDRVDYINTNFAFFPVEINGFESAKINHVDIEKITSEENPFCVKKEDGKISLTLKKDYGEALVTIKRG